MKRAILLIGLGIFVLALAAGQVYAAWIVTLPITVTNSSSTAIEDGLLLVEVPTGRLETSEYLVEGATVVITDSLGNAVPAIAGRDTTSGQTDTTSWLIMGDAPAGGTEVFNAEIGMDDEQEMLLPERTSGSITIPDGALHSGGYTTATGINVLADLEVDDEVSGTIAKQGTAWEVLFQGPEVTDGPYTWSLSRSGSATMFVYRFTPNAERSVTGAYGPDGCDNVGFTSNLSNNANYTWRTPSGETDNGNNSLYTFSSEVSLTNGTQYYLLFYNCRSQDRGPGSSESTATTYGTYRPLPGTNATGRNPAGTSQSYFQMRNAAHGLVIAGAGDQTQIQAKGTGGDTLEADWDGARATWRFRVTAGGASAVLQKLGTDGTWNTEASATNVTLTSSTDDVTVAEGIEGVIGEVSIGTPADRDETLLEFKAGGITVGLSSNTLSGEISNAGDSDTAATWSFTLASGVVSRSDFTTSWRGLEFQENMHMIPAAMEEDLPDVLGDVTAEGASTDALTPDDTEDTFNIMSTLRTAGLDSGIADAWWLILANFIGAALAAALARMWSNLWATLAIGLAANLAAMAISGELGPWVVAWFAIWSVPAIALHQRRGA